MRAAQPKLLELAARLRAVLRHVALACRHCDAPPLLWLASCKMVRLLPLAVLVCAAFQKH
jgi:hypothetical protein